MRPRARYATRTVHGSRRTALRELESLVAEVVNAASHAGTLADLLERWFAAASPAWAATTTAHTRSIVDCHLIPHLGHLPVAKVTTADIDDLYGFLLRRGGRDGDGLSPGTVRRIHAVLHRALVQALLWGWIWINPAAEASQPRVRKSELRPPTPYRSPHCSTTSATAIGCCTCSCGWPRPPERAADSCSRCAGATSTCTTAPSRSPARWSSDPRDRS